MVFLQQSFDVLMLQTTADRSNPKDIFTRPIKIGEGKFGKVFRAQNRKTDEVIAVKKLDSVGESWIKHELEAEQGFFVDSGALTCPEQESD